MVTRFQDRKITARNATAAVSKTAMLAGAAALLAIACGGVTATRANVQVEPIATREPFNRNAASHVLRTYPMPGDPHDAETSFNELYAAVLQSAVLTGDEPEPKLTQGSYIPRPGDPHDDFASWPSIAAEIGVDDQTSRVRGVAAPTGLVDDPENTPSVRPDYFPRPGDPHDDLYTE